MFLKHLMPKVMCTQDISRIYTCISIICKYIYIYVYVYAYVAMCTRIRTSWLVSLCFRFILTCVRMNFASFWALGKPVCSCTGTHCTLPGSLSGTWSSMFGDYPLPAKLPGESSTSLDIGGNLIAHFSCTSFRFQSFFVYKCIVTVISLLKSFRQRVEVEPLTILGQPGGVPGSQGPKLARIPRACLPILFGLYSRYVPAKEECQTQKGIAWEGPGSSLRL